MTDGTITSICVVCQHVYTIEHPFDGHCPTCGTSAPPIGIDVLAERHQAQRNGAELDPLIAKPQNNDAHILQTYRDGVFSLRSTIQQMKAEAMTLERQAAEVEQLDSSNPYRSGPSIELRERAAVFRDLSNKLELAEYGIAALFLAGDNREDWLRSPEDRGDGVLVYNDVPTEGMPAVEGICPHCQSDHPLQLGRGINSIYCESCRVEWRPA
jgi:hypothetical protein